MSDRMAAALAVGLALAVVAADARAAPCSRPFGSTSIRLTDCSVSRTSGYGVHVQVRNPDRNVAATIDLTRVDVSTTANGGVGVRNRHSGSGPQVIRMTGGSVTTTGAASGVVAYTDAPGKLTPSTIALSGVAISTTGSGVAAWHQARGAKTIRVTGGSITTTGYEGSLASGIGVIQDDAAGELAIEVGGGATIEAFGDGISVSHGTWTSSSATITLSDATIRSYGQNALYHYPDAAISAGRTGRRAEDGANGGIVIDLTRATLTAPPTVVYGRGVHAREWGVGNIRVNFASGRIRVGALNGEGVFAEQGVNYTEPWGRGSVVNHGGWWDDLGVGSIETTIGAEARIEAAFSSGVSGVLGSPKDGTGRIVVTHAGEIHAGGIRARDAGIFAWAARWSGSTFGDGYEATADDAARTAPMIHVTSSGDITVGSGVMDAFIRDVVAGADGTLSPAERRVFDAIVEDEDPDALETALAALPATWTDERKAEARALLASRTWTPNPIAWQQGFNELSDAEVDRLLGLSAAGIRALVHSHNRIADHVRLGNVDPELRRRALRPNARFTLTDKEKATFYAQHHFSEAEREIVKAVLAGGEGLEALLAPLPPIYTDAWKDETRRLALLYNEGDVRVDVTGGTITAEGYGVDARYAIPHDRNGAIAVTVAAGATVSGGRHGVHVGGAGLAAGGALRDQTVTVNGDVRGGTGAGVHLAGGGTVTVGGTGRVGTASGVGILSEGAGALVATVAGAVDGDVRAMGGDLTFASLAGSSVTGTVHDPAGPLTVHGSVGRLLYANGGTVTVASTGRLAGVVVEGRREAVRSEAGDLNLDVAAKGMVSGDVRALGGGDLDATVSGAVEGGLRAMGGGALTVDVKEGGAVTGTVHDPAGPLTVRGSIGRLLYASGGTVTVAGTGRLTGVVVEGGGEAIRSEAGDLSLNVAAMGSVAGNVIAEGDGDLSALVAGTLTGDLVEEGAGDLNATISGVVEGDVFGRGAGEHTVTVSKDGTVTGAIHLSASVVTVDGAAGRVRFDRGGMVTIGPQGRITDPGTGIEARGGELVVVVRQDAGETPGAALSRGVRGGIVEEGGAPDVLMQREGEAARRVPVGATGTASSLPGGVWDVSLEETEAGVLRFVRDVAPRSRVYEALPSVLLGLNAPTRYEERMAAPRAEKGGWARVETFRGKWKADASTSRKESGVGLKYDHRRHGLQAGVEAALGEDGLFGVSLHHRRGSADVSEGGKVELSGNGVGVSGAWRGDAVYVDVQAEATWYEADLASSRRGVLKADVSGRGHALGLEAGRRIALDGATLTPRARLAYSRVDLDDFTDGFGGRVSLEKGRSVTARVGAAVESAPLLGGGRLFGSVDVERELERERRVSVSGMPLASEASATRYLVGFGGILEWSGGRYAVSGKVNYAVDGSGSRDYGGGVNLTMRF